MQEIVEQVEAAGQQRGIVKPDLRGHSENLRVTYRGVEYRWSGGFGSIIESVEVGVKQDEVRQFGNVTLYAWRVDKPMSWRKCRVCWSAVGVDAEWIREFKRELFSV